MFVSQNVRPSAHRAAARSALAAAAALIAVTAAPSAASADAYPNDVELRSVFAMPVDATPTGVAANDARVLCNPEPAGHSLYGTTNPFNSANRASTSARGVGYPARLDDPTYPASSNYSPANFPSNASLTPALQAGASNDLCFGFTLTPNVQPDLIIGPSGSGYTGHQRFQDEHPVPDVPATHVAYSNGSSGDPIDNDDLKDVTIDMPAGFAGAPDGRPTCSNAQWGEGNYFDPDPSSYQDPHYTPHPTCPANSVVGTAYTRVSLDAGGLLLHLALGGGPNPAVNALSEGANVFNLSHGPNELARLGVSITPADGITPAKFVTRLILDPDGSGRIRAIVQNAPRRVYTAGCDLDGNNCSVDQNTGQLTPLAESYPVYVESIGIRAFGSAADHSVLNGHDFAQWGTDCSTALSASASIDTYLGVQSSMKSNEFHMTGCDQLPFSPTVDVQTTEKSPGVPTAASVTVNIPQPAGQYREALLKDASVTLPAGLEIGAQAGSRDGGLKLCSADQFGAKSPAPDACPAGSSVGDLTIATPLLDTPFTGHVFLGAQSAVGELPALYLEATPTGATAADAPRIKLVGSVKADANGQLTTTFTDAPQLRFNLLKLDFSGGPSALFSTPRSCGTTSGTSSFTSSASTIPVTATSSLTINQNCDTPAFAPSLTMTPSNSKVASTDPTTITIARGDNQPWLTGVNVALPTGFLANLKLASECPAAQAATGDCSESSRIGTVTTTAGVGSTPLTLSGNMYLSERDSGAVAGAVIVVRAKIGELDLGNVVVPARIDLRPTDAGLTLTTTAPTRFKGLALNLRSISVALDKPSFPLNPTACGPLSANGSFTADTGATATSSSSVTYTGCKDLPFKPSLSATLVGDTSVVNTHPTLTFGVTTRPGDSNLKTTSVTLPPGLVADLKNVQVTCTQAQFYSQSCPAATHVGSAKASVAITSDQLSGDVFLIHIDGQILPGLGLSFTGRYTQQIPSLVATDVKTHQLVATFQSIPDLPLTSLNLTIDGGAKSPIVVSVACTPSTSFDVAFSGQGGQTATQKVPYPCANNAVQAAPTLKWSKKSGIKVTLASPTGKTLKSAKITLPSGYTIKTGKSKKAKAALKKNVKVSVSGGKSKTKISSKSIALVGSGAGPTKATITVKAAGLTLSKKVKKSFKKGKSVKITYRIVTSDGKVLASSKTFKVTS